jgi:hypothetical protein
MTIKITYKMDGVYHDHLAFQIPRIARRFLEAIKKRGATDIKIEGEDELYSTGEETKKNI